MILIDFQFLKSIIESNFGCQFYRIENSTDTVQDGIKSIGSLRLTLTKKKNFKKKETKKKEFV